MIYAWLFMEALQTESMSGILERVSTVLEFYWHFRYFIVEVISSTYFLSDRFVYVIKILKTFEKILLVVIRQDSQFRILKEYI